MNNRFSESQLKQRGYYKDASGNWSRRDSENRDKRPPVEKLERDASDGRKTKSSKQKRRKRKVQSIYRYRIIITSYRVKLIDPSNACYKAIEDCLIVEGFLPDDSPDYCDQPLLLQHKVKKGEEKTVVSVLRYKIKK